MAPLITWEYDFDVRLAIMMGERFTNTDDTLVLYADSCGPTLNSPAAWAVSWRVQGNEFMWDASNSHHSLDGIFSKWAEMKSVVLAVQTISHLLRNQTGIVIFNDCLPGLCALQQWDGRRDAPSSSSSAIDTPQSICRDFWAAAAAGVPITIRWVPDDSKHGIFAHTWADFAANLASGRGGLGVKYSLCCRRHASWRDTTTSAPTSGRAGVLLDRRVRAPTADETLAWLEELDAEWREEMAAAAAAAATTPLPLSPPFSRAPTIASASSTLSLPPLLPPAASVKRARDEEGEGGDGAGDGDGQLSRKHERLG
ncbi:uncharacterized protein BKA78DRAFT_346624 [Phyllosticta capitalensis]|uniref:uncharacterized protein n=1 Tax=Phyllosticta capitalensis TaxID=121624 RepID=UPI003130C167